MTKLDGGPAFPAQTISHMEAVPDRFHDQMIARPVTTDHAGMTMRDYFAAQALIPLGDLVDLRPDMAAGTMAVLARHSYAFADAMLAERAKETK